MKVARYLGFGLLGVLVLLGAGVAFLAFKSPASRPPPEFHAQTSPEAVAHGKYLFDHVLACAACHSPRNYDQFSAPLVAGATGSGACFPSFMQMPGQVCAPNLTSDPTAGLGKWSDGEIARAIREGVSRDGHALAPMMPFQSFRSLSDDDLGALIGYLRTLPPSTHKVEATRLALPERWLAKLLPSPLDGPVKASAARGQYLVSVAGCGDCHTSDDAKAFAGGEEMHGPGGVETPANLTPDPETGLGQVSKADFVARFHSFQNVAANQTKGYAVMPWVAYAGMNDEDLGAIYDYLHTLKPVKTAPPKEEK